LNDLYGFVKEARLADAYDMSMMQNFLVDTVDTMADQIWSKIEQHPDITWAAAQLTADPLEARRLVEKYFPMVSLDVVANAPKFLGHKDRTSLAKYCDNARQGKVHVHNMRKPKEGWRAPQLALRAARTRAQYIAAIEHRQRQVRESLATAATTAAASVSQLAADL
jgi:hypothetical protein